MRPDIISPQISTTEPLQPPTQTPEEEIAYMACENYLSTLPGYQGTYSFGTPGGNDLDLRLSFADLGQINEDEVKKAFIARLRAGGVDKDVDLLFMSSNEFKTGIRDLVELGGITERLKDGFDPHEGQAAVGDTSMFSLYIFATMRPLHESEATPPQGSPQEALERLTLTPVKAPLDGRTFIQPAFYMSTYSRLLVQKISRHT